MAKRFERLLGMLLESVLLYKLCIIDKATDCTLLEPNWDGILECVDSIRSGDAPYVF